MSRILFLFLMFVPLVAVSAGPPAPSSAQADSEMERWVRTQGGGNWEVCTDHMTEGRANQTGADRFRDLMPQGRPRPTAGSQGDR